MQKILSFVYSGTCELGQEVVPLGKLMMAALSFEIHSLFWRCLKRLRLISSLSDRRDLETNVEACIPIMSSYWECLESVESHRDVFLAASGAIGDDGGEEEKKDSHKYPASDDRISFSLFSNSSYLCDPHLDDPTDLAHESSYLPWSSWVRLEKQRAVNDLAQLFPESVLDHATGATATAVPSTTTSRDSTPTKPVQLLSGTTVFVHPEMVHARSSFFGTLPCIFICSAVFCVFELREHRVCVCVLLSTAVTDYSIFLACVSQKVMQEKGQIECLVEDDTLLFLLRFMYCGELAIPSLTELIAVDILRTDAATYYGLSDREFLIQECMVRAAVYKGDEKFCVLS